MQHQKLKPVNNAGRSVQKKNWTRQQVRKTYQLTSANVDIIQHLHGNASTQKRSNVPFKQWTQWHKKIVHIDSDVGDQLSTDFCSIYLLFCTYVSYIIWTAADFLYSFQMLSDVAHDDLFKINSVCTLQTLLKLHTDMNIQERAFT
jgi:hypothetical protein